MSICVMSICAMSSCVTNQRDVHLCDVKLRNVNLCDGTLLMLASPHGTTTPTHNTRTARHQTRMPVRRQDQTFPSPHGTAAPQKKYPQQGAKPTPHRTPTPNTIYAQQCARTRAPRKHQHQIFASAHGTATPKNFTQKAAKRARQENVNADFSYLHMGQPPRTQFTHSKAPAPHARKTSTHNGASPHVTAAPNTIYTRQGTKPACMEDVNTKFSHLRMGQPPRTQFIPTAKRQTCTLRKPSTHNFRSPHGTATKPACREDVNTDSNPKHNLQTARRQTRMPGRHQHRQPPRTQFTHSKAPNPHARTTYHHQVFASNPLQPGLPRKSNGVQNDAKAYIRPIAAHQAPRLPGKSSGVQNDASAYVRPLAMHQMTPERTSPLAVRQVPRMSRCVM